jgi:hypothetical protein
MLAVHAVLVTRRRGRGGGRSVTSPRRSYQLYNDKDKYAEVFVDVGYDKPDSQWDCDTFSTCTGCDRGNPPLPRKQACGGLASAKAPSAGRFTWPD